MWFVFILKTHTHTVVHRFSLPFHEQRSFLKSFVSPHGVFFAISSSSDHFQKVAHSVKCGKLCKNTHAVFSLLFMDKDLFLKSNRDCVFEVVQLSSLSEHLFKSRVFRLSVEKPRRGSTLRIWCLTIRPVEYGSFYFERRYFYHPG